MATGYVTHKSCAVHDLPGHPEHAGRIKQVWQELESSGVLARLQPLEPKPATDAQILAVHDKQHLDMLMGLRMLDRTMLLDSDTYVLPETPEIARLAAGATCEAVSAVMNGAVDNALVAVRPPGHHAVPSRAMGFCLLGNIGVAARHAQTAHDAKRVMIVDYDVHHGNGTQDMFYDDESVLFISTHQYPFYPGSGAINDTGRGKGRGYTLNIPLGRGHGDANYARIFAEIIWPAARRFQPDLILVSAGFDAHWVDPLASMNLTLAGYAQITRELIKMAEELCGGRIVFLMEGGYDLTALSHGIRNIAHALLGEDMVSDPLGKVDAKEPEIDPLIERIRKIHGLDGGSDE